MDRLWCDGCFETFTTRYTERGNVVGLFAFFSEIGKFAFIMFRVHLPTFRCTALMAALGASSALSPGLWAQQKHLEITGSERLRIIYATSFTWPGESGESAVMDLPVPPETGGQHIENF